MRCRLCRDTGKINLGMRECPLCGGQAGAAPALETSAANTNEGRVEVTGRGVRKEQVDVFLAVVAEVIKACEEIVKDRERWNDPSFVALAMLAGMKVEEALGKQFPELVGTETRALKMSTLAHETALMVVVGYLASNIGAKEFPPLMRAVALMVFDRRKAILEEMRAAGMEAEMEMMEKSGLVVPLAIPRLRPEDLDED